MKINGLKIVVTGGAGFIGSHLVEKLLNGNTGTKQVTVFDNFSTGKRENLPKNPNLHIINGDVRNIDSLKTAFRGADLVFHLATHCVRLSLMDPATNHEVNATGTLNTLIAAKETGVKRYLYCSSSEVYGNTQDESLLNEKSEKNPSTIYGSSKLVGELYALAYHQTHGLPAMVVRPFNAYGPRSHLFGPYGEVIPRFAILAQAGRPPVVFGDGKQTRDFTYVEDTAAALIACAGRDELLGDCINIAHGAEVSVLELASTLCELTGSKVTPKHIDDRPGDIRRLGADTQKSRSILGNYAPTAIREGLKHYLGWLNGQKLDYEKLASKLTEKNWTENPSQPAK